MVEIPTPEKEVEYKAEERAKGNGRRTIFARDL